MWTKKAIPSLVSLIFIIFAIIVKATDVQAWKDLSTPSSQVRDNDTSMRGFDPRAIQMLHKNRPVAARYSKADLGQQRAVESRRDIKDFISNSLFYQQGYLKSGNPLTNEFFGCAVKINRNLAIVGAPYQNTSDKVRSGAAYIYERVGDEWQLKSSLASQNPEEEGNFGWSVDIAGDFAIVGAPFESNSKGAAYLFRKDSQNSWGFYRKLTLGNDAQELDGFGYSVALSENYLLISSPWRPLPTNPLVYAGAVFSYIFELNDWQEDGIILANEPGDWSNFGQSVYLDGNSVIIGAPFYTHESLPNIQGAAFIFSRNEGSWEQQAILYESMSQDNFGCSVAMSGDYAIIGCSWENSNAGAAYLFKRNSQDEWTKQIKFQPKKSENDGNFGAAVDISKKFIIIGAYGQDEWSTNSGAAYVYKLDDTNNNWSEFLTLKPLDILEKDSFGSAVSIDDSYLLVSSTQEDGVTVNSGAAYVFKIGPSEQCSTAQVEPLVGGSVRVSWTRGNGDGCAVFVKEGSSGSAEPVDNTIYTANATFGQGDQIGNSGWYCVYNGTETSVEISGLNSRTSYRIHVCEYINGSVYYNTNTSNNNPITYETPIAVKLAAFRASKEGQRVRISWRTENEADLAGFALHAAESEKGPFRRISSDVIPANGGQTRGADYVYWDETPNAEKQWYRLELIHLDGGREWSQPIAVTALENSADKLVVALHPNYPNPFNAQTLIRFDLPEAVETELAVYDARGRLVTALMSGIVPAGSHEVVWDGRDAAGNSLASGVYYCRLKTAEQTMLQKMILVK